MHASHVKKKLTKLLILSLKFQNMQFYDKEKFSDLCLMKIKISFKIRKKNSNMYLMKIQISFEIRKKNQIYI